MTPYPFLFHVSTSQWRPTIVSCEPNDLDEVFNNVPPTSRGRGVHHQAPRLNLLGGLRHGRGVLVPRRMASVSVDLRVVWRELRGSRGPGVVSSNWFDCVVLSALYMFKPSC